VPRRGARRAIMSFEFGAFLEKLRLHAISDIKK